MLAARAGYAAAVQWLVDVGDADLDAQDAQGSTALMHASAEGREQPRCMEVLTKAAEDRRAARKSLTSAEEEDRTQGARKNPRWIPNDEAARCMHCQNTEFWKIGLETSRRHHCRCCGFVVCLACMPDGQTVQLDQWVSLTGQMTPSSDEPSTTAQRVCNSCKLHAPGEVQARLQRAAELDIRRTPSAEGRLLHNAVTSASRLEVEVRLTSGADINALDVNGDAPLH
eukprot:COSAG02_NODE_24694_length_680_cov_0.977625_1_plen_226_part_11